MTAVTSDGAQSHTVAMGTVLNLVDRLANALTGTGTSRDARASTTYAYAAPLTQYQLAAAYQSGLMRKIVRIPAFDMVREWRTWTGLQADEAARVYALETKLGLAGKVLQAETLRAMGGGALILGLPGDPSQPAPANGEIAFVHVVSRWNLSFDRLQDDFSQPVYGEPAMWKLDTTAGQKEIHPSRVIPFRADTTAALALPGYQGADAFWGESVIAQVLDAVQDSDTARVSFAALIHKARLLRIGIPRLMEMAASGKDKQVMERLAILATAESIHNATVYDAGDGEGKGGEEIKDAQYNFAGAKDVLNAFAEFVSAISDIPATRLLGRAPEGMNSSGDSQQKDWNKKVRAMQRLQLAPCLDRLTPHLTATSTAAYDFDLLDTPGEKENAERFKIQMEAAEKLRNMDAMPDEVFSRGVQSLMIEEGYLPELETALAELSDEERYGIALPEGGDLDLEGGGWLEQEPPLRRAANDAAPRTLYVSRPVHNRADLQRWATAQGLGELQADLHVTIAYSRTPVDWMEIDGEWNQGEDGTIDVAPGGVRIVEPLGDRTAVLLFTSSALTWRHEQIVRSGASWDYPDYQPHISLTGEAVDLSGVEPYRGKIELGPERFEEIDEDH